MRNEESKLTNYKGRMVNKCLIIQGDGHVLMAKSYENRRKWGRRINNPNYG